MKILLFALFVIALVIGAMHFFPKINFRPMPSGLLTGDLPDGKPNWVSSFVTPANPHYLAPLPKSSLVNLASCMEQKLPGVHVTRNDAKLLIAYRQSKVFRFVDWLCIHSDGNFASSATLGRSDFGKNRELMEQIRALCLTN